MAVEGVDTQRGEKQKDEERTRHYTEGNYGVEYKKDEEPAEDDGTYGFEAKQSNTSHRAPPGGATIVTPTTDLSSYLTA